MWILFAFGSAFFAGITAVLAKCGVENVDSDVATALRTIIVLIFSWIMVFVTGGNTDISSVSFKTWVFLILSGMATGASWLCYFKALQQGDINKVAPIDKSSAIITMILAIIFLNEALTALKAVSIVLIAAGTYMMIEKKQVSQNTNYKSSWLLFALASAFFAALTSILGKVGIENIDSNLGTAIRTFVVLIMAWIVVFVKGKAYDLRHIDVKSILFIVLSGIATGCSWLCYYRALQGGPASVVVPIDKLSILVTILFSYIVFKERLTKKSLLGLILIVIGTLLLLVP
ncbi:MAG: EamA family transporter [Clostridia bacterium]|nr:EamA family transporter [Clostridia bacterium]